MTPRERAERSAQAMWATDHASQHFGMQIVSVDEGQATLSMEIQPFHANGHGIAHGGVIFSLADSAFAFACNSRNRVTVAQQNQITFLAPGRVGDRLTAEARQVGGTGRSGLYDVTVTNPEGTLIAQFRGLSREIKGQLFEE